MRTEWVILGPGSQSRRPDATRQIRQKQNKKKIDQGSAPKNVKEEWEIVRDAVS